MKFKQRIEKKVNNFSIINREIILADWDVRRVLGRKGEEMRGTTLIRSLERLFQDLDRA